MLANRHVALDGTKVKANASKHKAMSYERMTEAEKKLEEEVANLLAKAQAADAAEDEQYGKDRRGDELPAQLARRDSRLAKIRESKAALEQEAKEQAAREAEATRAKLEERRRQEEETGSKTGGRPPTVPDPEKAIPGAKAQRNLTDPESRIMQDGATKGFEQAYNAQAAVDGEVQAILFPRAQEGVFGVEPDLPDPQSAQAFSCAKMFTNDPCIEGRSGDL